MDPLQILHGYSTTWIYSKKIAKSHKLHARLSSRREKDEMDCMCMAMNHVHACMMHDHHHRHICGRWWAGVSSWESGEQLMIDTSWSSSLSSINDGDESDLLSSIILRIFSNISTSHGNLRTPSCWNPNSSSASLSRIPNTWWLRYSVGITNLFSSFPTHTATYPFGTTAAADSDISVKDSVFFKNLMLLLAAAEVVVGFVLLLFLLVLASFFHFLRICWSLTMSLILFDFLDDESISVDVCVWENE